VGGQRRRRAARGGSILRAAAAAAILTAFVATPAPAAPVIVRIMELNIEYGGTLVSFQSVVEAIEAADADVVAIEESWGNVPRLAEALGYHHDVRLQILSRYPLIDPPGADGLYVFVQLAPGRVIAVGNVHLPSGPYGPNLIRGGANRAQVLEVERRVRLPAVRPSVEALAAVTAQGIPAFLLGDFNAPSHHDWVEATVGIRPHVRFPVRWPVSAFVERHGFRDSYRQAHPDPVAAEGLTWPSGRPMVDGWNPGPNAPADRIDLIYAAGAAQTLASELVGEVAGPGVDIAVDPWPTDHRGVVSTFTVEPGEPPVFVAPDERLVEAGEDLGATFHRTGDADAIVVTRPRGDEPLATVATGAALDGTVGVPTAGLEPGGYALRLQAGSDVVSRSRFWVAPPGAVPAVSLPRRSFASGEPIRVRWANAPGQRWDWIGVYERGADPNVASYLTWFYTEASVQGRGLLDEASEGPWPLPPGRYSVYLLSDDGYDVLARTRFTVRS
jgi:Endonuclease/Exonuclease/phosphatase family